MLRAVSSQRNTPANLPFNGTTALLKTLLAVGNGERGMTGLFEYRHITLSPSAGLSCQGMLASASPMIVPPGGEIDRMTGVLAAIRPPVDAIVTKGSFQRL